MSKTVDERVVQMKFDNRQFEQGVSQTMSTLDKFKQKLNLTGASKGLDEVQKSAKDLNNNMSFNNAEKSLSSLEKRFSSLGIAGMTVIQNLTNSMLNFAKKVSDYSIGGIITGGKNRATKIENARFQIKGLLRDYEDAEKRLNDIMADVNYGVESTAYGLDAAATVAAQLVASGIQAGDGMKKALRGISGVAAMTNSSYEEIGRIYTKIAGNGRLMGEELLQLSSRGMNAAAVLAKSMNKSEAEVRDMVSKGQISFEKFSKAMDDAFGKHAKDANKTLNGVLSNIKAALAKIGADFFTPIIEQESPLVLFLNSIRERINDIRKNLKLITKEMTDGLNSFIKKVDNWFKRGETHRFGFSPISEILKPLQKAENVFETVTETAGRFSDKIREIEGKINKTLGPLNEAGNVVKKVTDAAIDYHKIVDQIIYGTWDNGRPRLEKLTEAGINYYKAQNMVNERLGAQFRYSQDIIDQQDEMLGLTKKQTTATENYDNSEEGLLKTMQELTDEELKQYGLTDDQVQAFRELDKVAKMTGLSMSYILDVMKEGKFDTRFLVFNSLKNIGASIITIFKAIGQAFMDAFQISDSGLFSLIASFHRLTELIKNFINDNAEGLTNIFRGIFSILHLIVTVGSGAFKAVMHILNTILEAFGMNITDLIGQIGLLVFNIEKWITSDNGLIGIIRKVVDWLAISIKTVIQWIKSNSKVLEIINKIKQAFVGIGQAFNNWMEGLRQTDNVPKYIFEGLINGIKEYGPKVFQAIGTVITGLIDTVKNMLGIHSPSKVFFAIGGFIIAGLVGGIVSGEYSLFDVLKGLVDKVKDFFKGINLGNLIAAGLVGGITFVTGKLMLSVNRLVNGIANLTNSVAFAINNFGTMLSNIVKGLKNLGKSLKYQAIAEVLKGLTLIIVAVVASIVILGKLPEKEIQQGAIAMGVIAAALIGITYALYKMSDKLSGINLPGIGQILVTMGTLIVAISTVTKSVVKLAKLEPGKLWSSVAAMIVLMGALGTLLFAITEMAKHIKGAMFNTDQLSNVLIKISAALYIVAMALKKMNKVEWSSIGKMTIMIIELGLLLTAVAFMNGASGGGLDKSARTILAVGGCLLVLAFAMRAAGKLKFEDFIKASAMIGMFLTMMLALMGISELFKGTEMIKVSGSIILVAGTIGLLALVTKMVGGIKPEELTKGLILITALGALVGALIVVAKTTESNERAILGLGTTLLGIAIVLGVMAAAVVVLGSIRLATLAKGIAAVGFISLFVKALLAVAKDFQANKQAMKALIGITALIGVLAVIAVAFSFIETSKLIPAVLAVDSMILSLSALLYTLGKMKLHKKVLTNLFAITAVIAALAGVVALLTNFTDTRKLIAASAGLSVMILSISGVMAVLSKLGNTAQLDTKVIGSLLVMTGILGILGLVLAAMSALNTNNSVANAIAISILAITLGSVLAAMAGVSKIIETTDLISLGATMLAFVALSATMLLLATVLNKMNGTQNAIQNATALSILAVALGTVIAALAGIGALAGTGGPLAIGGLIVGLLAGVIAMGLLIAELQAIVGVLSSVNDVNKAKKSAQMLTDVLTTLSDVLLKISLVAPLALMADVAIGGLILAMTAIAGLASAIGGLDVLTNGGLQKILDVGLPMLEQLALAIGHIIGNVIAGLMDSIFSILPMLGTRLSQFAENVEEFVILMEKVHGDRIVSGATALAGSILALSGAQIINGISNLLGFGSSFWSMGLQLSQFGENVKPFLETMSKVPRDATEGIKRLAEAVGVLTASNFMDSITKFFFGSDKNIARFGNDFADLGKGIKGFSDALGGGINYDNVKAGAEAVKTLAEAAKTLPASGGWLEAFTGSVNISDFKTKFPDLAEGIKGFTEKLGNDFDGNKAKSGASAVKDVADACGKLPTDGGIFKFFTGDNYNTIDKFKDKFPALGEGIKGFTDALGDNFDGNKAQSGASAVKAVAEAIKDIGPTDFKGFGIDASLDLDKVKDNMPKLGEGMAALVDKLKDTDPTQIQNATNMLWSISDLAKGGAFDTNGKKLEEFGACFSSFAYKMAEAMQTLTGISKENSDEQIKKIEAFKNVAEKVNGVDKSKLEEFGESFKKLGNAGVEAFEKSMNGEEAKNKMTGAVSSIIESIKKTVGDNTNSVEDKFSDMGNKAYEGVNNDKVRGQYRYWSFYNLGKNFVEGFADGIKNNIELATKAADKLGYDTSLALQTSIDSNSPSKVTLALGNYFGQGFVIGINEYSKQAGDAAGSMADYATEGLQNAVSKVYDVMSSGIDDQLTIRPVLDLSEVESGVGTLDSMLDFNKDMSLSASLNSISTGINRRLQNRGNDDIISAIKDLSNSISGNTGNTYNVNGVAYSDSDTEVTNAIRTLVNAAVVERRT